MGRFAAVVVLGVSALAPAAFGGYADAAAAREAVLAEDSRLSGEDRGAALDLLKREWERGGADARTVYALVKVCEASNDWDTGLPAARALAEMAPGVADYQAALGNALFMTIDEVSLFNKGARAAAGRKAYERAIELDPKHVEARTGLCFYYMQAPGFAGGSVKKARAIAEEMAGEDVNASTGYELLMALAAHEEDWEEYERLLPRAMEAADTDEARAGLLMSALYGKLFREKDYAAGLGLAGEYRAMAGDGEGGYTTNYFEGVALHGLGRFDEAVEKFEMVLGVEPNARNTRWLAAESCEELGRKADAAGHYAEFAERFGDDDRAKQAKKKAKSLGR